MANILNFKKKKAEKMNAEKQSIPYATKVWFLFEQTYQYYCDLHKIRIGDAVDIHWSHYARKSTFEALIPVIQGKRVNKCFAKRVSELKRYGRTRELRMIGVL